MQATPKPSLSHLQQRLLRQSPWGLRASQFLRPSWPQQADLSPEIPKSPYSFSTGAGAAALSEASAVSFHQLICPEHKNRLRSPTPTQPPHAGRGSLNAGRAEHRGAVETEDGPDAGSPARVSAPRSLRTKLETEKLRATGYFTQKEREGAKAPNPQSLDPHPATYAATVCLPGQQKGRRQEDWTPALTRSHWAVYTEF